MKVRSLITWPPSTNVGVIEGNIYDVQDSSNYPKQVGVISEDKTCLTWLTAGSSIKEFEVIEE